MSTPDPNLVAAMRNIAATSKSSFPWKRDAPYVQPYFTYSLEHNTWVPCTDATTPLQSPSTNVHTFSLISWNIDFMLPLTSARLSAALSYLERFLFSSRSSSADIPKILFLQEMLVSDLQQLQSTPWVRDYFHLTDVDDRYWESGYYGTCTLIDRRLPVKEVFRVHYSPTKMERDGLFVDIAIGMEQVLRFCNTHLESLVADPPLRPAQMTIAAQYMRAPTVHASFLAGDLNAIQPFDRKLHSDNGLQDAYLELGGKEDSDDGYTWGQQVQTKLRNMFGCSRMDKVYYWGGAKVQRFERIGVDVEVEKEDDKQLLMQQGLERGWVTDHLGVMAEFAINGLDGQVKEMQSKI